MYHKLYFSPLILFPSFLKHDNELYRDFIESVAVDLNIALEPNRRKYRISSTNMLMNFYKTK